jgi:hypothetical protein
MIDRAARKEFAMTILENLDKDNEYLRKIMLSDEVTFHVSGKVNIQNVCIWGSEHPHATVQHIRDSPKVMCGVICCTIVWLDPFSLPK